MCAQFNVLGLPWEECLEGVSVLTRCLRVLSVLFKGLGTGTQRGTRTSYSKESAEKTCCSRALGLLVKGSRMRNRLLKVGNVLFSVLIDRLGLCKLAHSHDASDFNTLHAQTCTGREDGKGDFP